MVVFQSAIEAQCAHILSGILISCSDVTTESCGIDPAKHFHPAKHFLSWDDTDEMKLQYCDQCHEYNAITYGCSGAISCRRQPYKKELARQRKEKRRLIQERNETSGPRFQAFSRPHSVALRQHQVKPTTPTTPTPNSTHKKVPIIIIPKYYESSKMHVSQTPFAQMFQSQLQIPHAPKNISPCVYPMAPVMYMGPHTHKPMPMLIPDHNTAWTSCVQPMYMIAPIQSQRQVPI